MAVRRLRGRHDLVHGRVEPAVSDVVGDRAGEQQRRLHHEAHLVAQAIERQVLGVVAVDPDRAVLGVVEAHEQVHERRLAGAGRTHDSDAVAGLALEGDVLEGVLAALVGEAHVLELDGAARASDVDRVRLLDDLGLLFEDRHRRVQEHHALMQVPDRLADVRERLVHGRDVRDQDDHLAQADVALEHVVGAEPEHDRRAQRDRRGNAEREHRLVDRQPHARVDRGPALRGEAVVLEPAAAERDDHPQHRHRLEDDRQGSQLEALHALDARHDARAVQPDRPVEERDADQRHDRHLPVDQQRDHQHADQHQDALEDAAGTTSRSRRAT